jgi:hypothetical protein
MTQKLTPADEYFNHQTPFTHDTVFTSDPNFRERQWVNFFDTESLNLVADFGMARYPNRNIQEGWAGVTIGDRQYNVRASRHLRPDYEMSVGPLRIEQVEPLKKTRYVLEKNESPVSFDLTLEILYRPHVEDLHLDFDEMGRIKHNLTRYYNTGVGSGHIRVGDKTYEVDRAKWKAGRDHGWGVLPHPVQSDDPLDAAHVTTNKGFFTGFGMFSFPDWSATFIFTEIAPKVFSFLSGAIRYLPGDPRPDEKIYSFEHEMLWADAPNNQMTSGVWTLITEARARNVRIRPGNGKYYIRSAGYQGCDGWFQGSDMGANWFTHDQWDLKDPETLQKYSIMGGFFDHVAELECDGVKGYGVVEYLVAPGFYKYAELFERRRPR